MALQNIYDAPMTIFLHENDIPNDLDLGSVVAVDSETMGLKLHRDRLCVVQLSDGNGDAHLVRFEQDTYDAPNLKKLLGDPSIQKIFHFARFDVAAFQVYLGIETQNVYCTKIVSKMVRTYTDRHGLKELCKVLIGVDISKAQQCSDWGSTDLTEDQQKYAASDVLYLHLIKDKLDEMLEREGRKELAQSCFDFINTRAKLDILGWTDPDIFSHNS